MSPAPHDFGSPALTVSIALAAGILCQGLAHHLRIPGIVLLLAAGALLGPDVLGVVQPQLMGDTLQVLVGFAVAVILFEGGMNLHLGRLRRQSASIRRLVTVGAAVTAAGGAVAAHMLLHWDWRLSILFGTLVIVTGPTVVTPLIRRIRLNHRLQTVLEAEGVLIDPIGAIIAVVALEVAIQPSGRTFAVGLLEIVQRLGLGTLMGLAGGFLIGLMLRPKWLIPDGLENVFTLGMVWVLYQTSNELVHESGIATVTVAGLVVGNLHSRALNDLREFKEQLTVMLIGMLFVLLSADVGFSDVRALGWPGLATVGALMFVVRPLNVLAGTLGTDVTWRERLFLFWLAPRGIVAAAVASFFAVALDNAGIDGGSELRAMVFLVIAVTVLVQGLTGGFLAGMLGLRRLSNQGYVILGATGLGRALAAALHGAGEEVVLMDANAAAVSQTEGEGYRVIYGNALEERTLLRAQIDTRTGAVALTPNESVNLHFAEKAHELKVPKVYVALHRAKGQVTDDMVERSGAKVLFGVKRDIDLWRVRIRRGHAVRQVWRYDGDEKRGLYEDPTSLTEGEKVLLPLVRYSKEKVSLVDESTRFSPGDQLCYLLHVEQRNLTESWLRERGWVPVSGEDHATRHSESVPLAEEPADREARSPGREADTPGGENPGGQPS